MNSRLLAQIINPVLPVGLGNTTNTEAGGTAIGGLIGGLIQVIILIGVLLSMFYLITGAISWITSNGDKTALEAARNKIVHAILGLIILASVWAVMVLVSAFLGLTFPNFTIPTIGGGGASNVSTGGTNLPQVGWE